MEINLKIAELENKAILLGISDEVEGTELKNGKIRIGKKEWVDLLQRHSLQEKQGDANLKQVIHLSPMLCYRYTGLKESEKEAIWKSTDWGIEEKFDGVRIWIVFHDTQGFSFFSRHLSVRDFLPIEYSEKIFTMVDTSKVAQRFTSFIIDAEIICENPKVSTIIGDRGVITETQLQAVTALLSLNSVDTLEIQRKEAYLKFKCFDIVALDGQELVSYDYIIRKRVLTTVVDHLFQCGLNADQVRVFFNPMNKKNYYDSVIGGGGEGVVAKFKDSLYTPTNSRKRDGWVKVKRSASQTAELMGMGDSIDGFITGFGTGTMGTKFEGIVNSLEISSFVKEVNGEEKQEIIAIITGFSEALMEELTDEMGELNQGFYGRVVEIDGHNFSSRRRRLRHAVLKRFREDKTMYDCSMEAAFISANII